MQRAELDGLELRLEPGVCGLDWFIQTLVRQSSQLLDNVTMNLVEHVPDGRFLGPSS